MAIVFMMNEEIARGMVCFFHQKKHSYLIYLIICVFLFLQMRGLQRALCLQREEGVAHAQSSHGVQKAEWRSGFIHQGKGVFARNINFFVPYD
jgi:hypothetical protein